MHEYSEDSTASSAGSWRLNLLNEDFLDRPLVYGCPLPTKVDHAAWSGNDKMGARSAEAKRSTTCSYRPFAARGWCHTGADGFEI